MDLKYTSIVDQCGILESAKEVYFFILLKTACFCRKTGGFYRKKRLLLNA